MIKSVLAKIKNNIWLFICLIIGSLLITSILASIPIYTDGALRKMLRNDLDNYEIENGKGAGQLTAKIRFGDDYSAQGIIEEIQYTDGYINNLFHKNGVETKLDYLTIEMTHMVSDKYDETIPYGTNYTISSMSDIENHINIISGRMFDNELADDGTFEVIVTANTFNECNLSLGRTYTFYSLPPSSVTVMVTVVGVYEPVYDDYEYWSDTKSIQQRNLMVHSDVMMNHGLTKEYAYAIKEATWLKNIDFSGFQVKDLNPFVRTYTALDEYLEQYGQGKSVLKMPSISILSDYMKKSNSMTLTMWILVAPVLVMLAFYTFMVSKLIVEEDKNEIASMKSRGAKPRQIFSRYLVECGFISAFSLLLGPPLGLVIAQVIGSANGFLEFVNRTKLDARLLPEAYLYALIAAVVFTVMVLIPAYAATKNTIVQLKQKKARKRKIPLWELTFVDVILLGLSIYLLFLYKQMGTNVIENGMDPVVYFISTLFIIGAGLFFLRIYPMVVALIFKLTKKRLPPTLYSAFVQVFRTGNDNRFLMLFLILTISLGVYSSNSARVINTNVENSAKYVSGADIILSPAWKDDYEYSSDDISNSQYAVLPMAQFKNIEGIKDVTKVATIDDASLYSKKSGYWEDGVKIMAIEPYNFANVAWLSGSLNETHWYNYINNMEEYPTTVLLSSKIAKILGVDEGGTISVDVNETSTGKLKTFNCYVLGIIDYWPTYCDENSYNGDKGDLMVMNISYLQSIVPQLSYDIWLSKEEGVTSEQIYNSIEELGITDQLSAIQDRSTTLTAAKNDSLLKALNGSFSLGFIATMIISMIGFLIYWIMNVRKRKLQFGILRAMGLTRGRVTLMLFWEHMMTTGVSVLFGMLIGKFAIKLFLPLLQIAYGNSTIPLELVSNVTDNLRVYLIVLVMLVVGLVVLAGFINKLKINEAVKIGED